ncbi:single-stranded-DNA-specific exonuclease RecJ [Barrientosiimonas marina]|uniref:Single-stranded-DNA-specific exonuclease RecJ n=1 Tax=Lentibacillus kimchii TaxID=1542911 RepID=A0ABW2UVP1_9BACI
MLESKMKWNFADEYHDTAQWESRRFSPFMKEMLIKLGITSDEEAARFLSPELAHINSVQLLSMIDEAAERVYQSINTGEKILVYGDYDADGVTSTAIMIQTLKELGANCDYYIPNRFTEGYGPNEEAFKAASANGCRLIITVDTGIAAVHEAEVAKQLGIDLIITDHHEPQEVLPDAYATIHPNCSPSYPFKDLAGAGVAVKFAERLLGYFPEQFLDWLAIGTIADMVPLRGENRVFASLGLKALSAATKPGLIALKKVSGIEGSVDEEDIGFSLGPRINAVGRLQDANLAVQLLLSDNQEEASQMAETVQSINQKRQEIVNTIVKEAEDMIAPVGDQGVIVAAKEGWNQGVLGIVAANLVRKYDRPAIVMSIFPEEGTMKGSARSIPAFDLFSNCMRVKELFTHFGGHAQAAGMTMPLDNFDTLKSELHHLIYEQLDSADFTQEIAVTKSIALPEANQELVEEMAQLAPFGMANPKPVFHIKELPAAAKQVGQRKNHLKLQFHNQQKTLDAIGFGLGDLYDYMTPQTQVSVVGELGINEWNGFRKVQIIMQDMKIDEWQLFDHRGQRNVDMTRFVNPQRKQIAVYRSLPDEDQLPDHVTRMTYDAAIDSLVGGDTLFLFDLPTDLRTLHMMLQKLQPENIHVCFQVTNSAFMNVFPSKEDFKWLYKHLLQRKQLDMRHDFPMIMDAKGWTKDHLQFMADVFFDLGFVKMTDGTIELNMEPVKRDLTESAIYQERLEQAKIEKTLYYSTYDELQSWLIACMKDVQASGEEMAYGL